MQSVGCRVWLRNGYRSRAPHSTWRTRQICGQSLVGRVDTKNPGAVPGHEGRARMPPIGFNRHYNAGKMCRSGRGAPGALLDEGELATLRRVATLHRGPGAVVFRARDTDGKTFIVKKYMVDLMGLRETEVMRREVRVRLGAGFVGWVGSRRGCIWRRVPAGRPTGAKAAACSVPAQMRLLQECQSIPGVVRVVSMRETALSAYVIMVRRRRLGWLGAGLVGDRVWEAEFLAEVW